MEFPRYADYLQAVTQRDQGMLLVILIVLAGLIWLLNSRLAYPRLLPIARAVIVAGFYLSAVVMIGVLK